MNSRRERCRPRLQYAVACRQDTCTPRITRFELASPDSRAKQTSQRTGPLLPRAPENHAAAHPPGPLPSPSSCGAPCRTTAGQTPQSRARTADHRRRRHRSRCCCYCCCCEASQRLCRVVRPRSRRPRSRRRHHRRRCPQLWVLLRTTNVCVRPHRSHNGLRGGDGHRAARPSHRRVPRRRHSYRRHSYCSPPRAI